MKTIIVGSGYAGLNAYYNLNEEPIIISQHNKFVFYTSLTRSLLFKPLRDTVNIPFVTVDKVVEFDLKGKWIKTQNHEYNADNLIIATGCNREEQVQFIKKLRGLDRISIEAENEFYDGYLVIQLAFYLKKLGKQVYYHGSYLSFLGDRVAQVLTNKMSEKHIQYTEKADLVFPACKPLSPFQFFKVNEYLQYQNSFIIGDLIENMPKLGELAMRTGIYVGKFINDRRVGKFSPIFVTIIDTGSEGIHIRSDRPWGGNKEVVKISKLRQYMKRFIERYYIIRRGNMGFLYHV
ncbi:FAD-dependent pyridine nucleotide-disulfide oxidoreductase [Sulfolobus acidocaldarius SUSAZ]|nr:FAD-dependent pyridine nucleotide-disulfide oxidoreductase [Sulfolobus acidocaldarius SUSAZ]